MIWPLNQHIRSSTMKKIVVLLCGIPGSGKSSLGSSLFNRLQREGISSALVAFDAVGEDILWDELSFHVIRDLSLKKVDKAVGTTDEGNLKQVIVVDDLMYLRSMRRQVYQLARNRGCPLLVVWVQTSPSVAWERNSLRPKDGKAYVTEDSFNRIVSSFQPPAEEHICDRNSHIVDGMEDTSGSVDSLLLQLNRIFDDYERFSPKNKDESVEPGSIPQPTVQTSAKAADETLRKIVTFTIKKAKDLGADVKQLSGVLQRAKAEAFREFKSTWDGDDYTSLNDYVRDILVDHLHHVWTNDLIMTKSDLETYIQLVRALEL